MASITRTTVHTTVQASGRVDTEHTTSVTRADNAPTTEMEVVKTSPFEGQAPGTSGLRKKVPVFQQPHYLENFVQATFNAVAKPDGLEGPLAGSTLVVGGDGRFLVKEAAQTIIKMAYANGVGRVIVGTNGILSTPAVSALIRRGECRGGFILTASHNPGGPKGDFGIKYNISNGGPAPDQVTDRMLAETKTISEYRIAKVPDLDLSLPRTHVLDGGQFVVSVVDSVEDYLKLMQELFDFENIRSYIAKTGLNLRVDCMHGVAGPYATAIFSELGASNAVINNVPSEDFGGGHPDPNLTYAKSLVDDMATGKYDLGAAFDGDADRNMILGKNGFFVTPSDSVAIIAANADCIPYLAKDGIKGLSRSMPTGAALDHVAKKLNVPFFEVPTGWKYFGNLMDAGKLTICGEESFGTGSSHVREKDGVWAILCWLSILARREATVEEVCTAFWAEYGRNFFTRYDYEEVESEGATAMMKQLEAHVADPSKLVGSGRGITMVDNFAYTDSTNGEVATKKGIRILFEKGDRIIFRLSGTGSSGATIRMYVDSYLKLPDGSKPADYNMDTQKALKALVDIALEISELKKFTGRNEPTVIT
eukprot:m.22395 g.22395  ORF g.22395 m.22395 type:complete len:593 (-) comp3982_c0_seq1:185-1963(-)